MAVLHSSSVRARQKEVDNPNRVETWLAPVNGTCNMQLLASVAVRGRNHRCTSDTCTPAQICKQTAAVAPVTLQANQSSGQHHPAVTPASLPA